MCHETNYSSYETVRFCDIIVMKLDTLMEFNEKSLFYFTKYVLGDQICYKYKNKKFEKNA